MPLLDKGAPQEDTVAMMAKWQDVSTWLHEIKNEVDQLQRLQTKCLTQHSSASDRSALFFCVLSLFVPVDPGLAWPFAEEDEKILQANGLKSWNHAIRLKTWVDHHHEGRDASLLQRSETLGQPVMLMTIALLRFVGCTLLELCFAKYDATTLLLLTKRCHLFVRLALAWLDADCPDQVFLLLCRSF